MTLEEHYEDSYDILLRAALRATDNHMYNAEDIVQETYNRALQYQDSFNPALSTYHTWMCTILRRCIADFKRAEKEQVGYVEVKEHHIKVEGEALPNMRQASEILEELTSINGITKQILYLYFIRGYAPREIEKVVYCTNNTIRQLVHQFKTKMRGKYAESGI